LKLARVLGELVARLDAHGVAYAVVGGLAASARGEARFTRDEATHRLATARLKHPDGVVCDLIFATCGIESEIVTSAERVELLPGKWVTTATAESMVAMKVLSASAKRPRDLGDLQAMLRANPTFDESRVASLLRAIEARRYSRGQDLSEKWRRLRAELGE
jgi:hypothetical protein